MPIEKLSKSKSNPISNLSKNFSKNVTAFISDKSIDFDIAKSQFRLNATQKKFLKETTGVSIDHFSFARQVHGKKILIIKRPSCLIGNADGFITNRPGIPLTIRTADCLSVFLYDPKNKAVGLVHAGWKGSQKKIAAHAVRLMKKSFGTNPQDLKVAFGPSIQVCCYEVGKEFTKYFPKETKKRDNRFYLDLPLANRRQLIRSGVRPKNITGNRYCTFCDKQFFSYRRQGEKAGRMISVMMLRA